MPGGAGAGPMPGGAGAGTGPVPGGGTGAVPGQPGQQKPEEKKIVIPPDPAPLTEPAILVLGKGIDQWRARPEPLVGMRKIEKVPVDILHYSWLADILPFVGHDDVHKKFDFTKSWSDDKNISNSYQLIRCFLNPADTRNRYEVVFSPFEHMAVSHIVGISGVEDNRTESAAKLPRSHANAGVFGYDAVARLDEITDGTSQTVAILGAGEIIGPWVQGGGASVRGARATIVNGKETYFDPLTGFSSKGLAKAGTQALMADGSARIISAEIDSKVFRSLCTIHGADSVDLATDPNVTPLTP
jgi:hypothetical protein